MWARESGGIELVGSRFPRGEFAGSGVARGESGPVASCESEPGVAYAQGAQLVQIRPRKHRFPQFAARKSASDKLDPSRFARHIRAPANCERYPRE